MKTPIQIKSPPWMGTTKLLVGVVLTALLGLLLVEIRSLIAPLIMVIILIFVFRPLIKRLQKYSKLPWGLSVGIVYIGLILLIALLAAELGVALMDQASDLAALAQAFLEGPSDLLQELPFIVLLPIDLNVQAILEQGISFIQPVMGSVGGVVRSVAGTAASTVGWIGFIVVVSYFILLDLEPGRGWSLGRWTPEPYRSDMEQMETRLSQIWQGFLFGQGLLFVLTVAVVTFVLTLVGLSNALVLGLLSGLARFVPYLGPAVVWFLMFIVAFGQPDIPFSINPLWYASLVVALQVAIDQVFDNMVAPRLFGQVLGVHPAGVLITAIAAVLVIGPLGLLVGAPLLASIIQISHYIISKLFDLHGEVPSPVAVAAPPKAVLLDAGEMPPMEAERVEPAPAEGI